MTRSRRRSWAVSGSASAGRAATSRMTSPARKVPGKRQEPDPRPMTPPWGTAGSPGPPTPCRCWPVSGGGRVLGPKTAKLALPLQAAGATVSLYCPARSAAPPVVQALRERGLRVVASDDGCAGNDEDLAREFLRTRPDILLDDGATLIRLAHREFPDLVAAMLGAAEETTSGVRPLRVMQEAGELRLPVIAVNDARTKYLFDNVHGTGQSCVMALLDITNLQLAGRVTVVVGFGPVGQGVARYAAA